MFSFDARLNRAKQEFRVFNKRLIRFGKEKTYEISAQEDTETTAEQIANVYSQGGILMPISKYIDKRLILHIDEEVFAAHCQEWALDIDVIVHHARSALDNLVWHLTAKSQGGIPPEPWPDNIARRWKSIAFPVAIFNSQWQTTDATSAPNKRLWGVDPRRWPDFSEFQPCVGGQNYKSHWLWRLDEFWNRDKHRALPLVARYGRIERVSVSSADPAVSSSEFRQQFRSKVVERREFGPFIDMAELGRLRIFNRHPSFGQPPSAVRVNTKLTPNVLFGEGVPSPREAVLDVLAEFVNKVDGVLTKFRPYC